VVWAVVWSIQLAALDLPAGRIQNNRSINPVTELACSVENS
jgi:hypothetical protein